MAGQICLVQSHALYVDIVVCDKGWSVAFVYQSLTGYLRALHACFLISKINHTRLYMQSFASVTNSPPVMPVMPVMTKQLGRDIVQGRGGNRERRETVRPSSFCQVNIIPNSQCIHFVCEGIVKVKNVVKVVQTRPCLPPWPPCFLQHQIRALDHLQPCSQLSHTDPKDSVRSTPT